jgi:hypothetical protein
MAKTKQGAVTPEVMPAVLPEEQLTVGDGQTILTFINGLVPFFRAATQLEEAARDKLAKARLFTLPQPGDIDGDAKLQTFIRECSADKKKVEQHWIITSVIFQFQRKLVGARDRVIGDAKKDSRAGYLTEAAEIAQRLHNTFVEDARRRAAVEQQKREAEAAAKAAAERAAETAKLEAEAAEKELASADLSAREQRFVELVHQGQLPTAAARACGYAEPEKQGARLMTLTKILDAINAKHEAAILRQQATAVKEAPLDVQVENVRPDYTRVGVDRSTKSAELLNERLLIEAVLGGQHGIPTDILTVNTTKLNQYARDLGTVINRWPGVRLKTTTKTV